MQVSLYVVWPLLGTAVSNTTVSEDAFAKSWWDDTHVAEAAQCPGDHTAERCAQGCLLYMAQLRATSAGEKSPEQHRQSQADPA